VLKYILIGGVILISVYWLLPSLWFRALSKSTIKTAPKDTVTITFDDGPTPVTEQVLKTLEQAHVKANFFVLGQFAKEHPHLIKKELSSGHHIGLHGMNHKCHWFLTPWATYKDVKDSKATIEALGGRPVLFRPPWGLYNLFTVPACKKYNCQWVHWTLHTYDWDNKILGSQRIAMVANKAGSGDILLIHDGRGDEGSPEITAQALQGMIEAIHNKGLTTSTLEEGHETS
jgi:peptidoglycan/xylan/chitin deacetylase (PgdA/CDA1 family)